MVAADADPGTFIRDNDAGALSKPKAIAENNDEIERLRKIIAGYESTGKLTKYCNLKLQKILHILLLSLCYNKEVFTFQPLHLQAFAVVRRSPLQPTLL